MQKLLSELNFFSLFSYCPRGNSGKCLKSKDRVMELKQDQLVGNPPKLTTTLVAERLKKYVDQGNDENSFWGMHVVLVPVPSHGLPVKNGMWVSSRLAQAIVSSGLAYSFSPCLLRESAVAKSAYVSPEQRPKALDHYNSMRVVPTLDKPKNIVLVDDVVTRGATLLAGASLLKEVFPDAVIRGFAAVRTISDPEEFERFFDPRVGVITLRGGDTYRKP